MMSESPGGTFASGASDAGTESGSVRGGQALRASAQLTTFFMNAKEQQAQDILETIGNDLELQLIVNSGIANYVNERADAEAQGITINDMVANTVAYRKRKRDEEEEPEE